MQFIAFIHASALQAADWGVCVPELSACSLCMRAAAGGGGGAAAAVRSPPCTHIGWGGAANRCACVRTGWWQWQSYDSCT